MSEPTIVVNGTQLTEAQAMAVRVAVASFRDHDAKDPGLGDIGPLYHARLTEVVKVMSAAPPARPRYTWYIGTECQECGAQDQDTTLPACPECGWTHQQQTEFEKSLRTNRARPARR